MTLYHASFSGLVLRFYLMMAVVIVAGFSGMWMLSLLALPIFLSCMLGIQFRSHRSEDSEMKRAPEVRTAPMRVNQQAQHAA